MKKILGVFLSVVLLSCASQQFIENHNLESCTNTSLQESQYNFFDIDSFRVRLKEPESYQVEINTDSSKIFLMETTPNEAVKKYYLDITSKVNKLNSVFVYDSIGRLIRKYNNHTNTKVGEEIKINYSDANSSTPVETYRINYDTIYPICWKEALQIAERKGINAKESHVDILYPDHYWEEKKPMEWTIYDEDNIMYVDAFTGKASNLRKRGSGLLTNYHSCLKDL